MKKKIQMEPEYLINSQLSISGVIRKQWSNTLFLLRRKNLETYFTMNENTFLPNAYLPVLVSRKLEKGRNFYES